MTTSSPLHHALLFASTLVLLASACQSEPSVRLRWRIVPSQPGVTEAPLTSATQCSGVGVASVTVDAYEAGARANPPVLPITSDEYPCFPAAFLEPDGLLDGPKLDPGEYDLVITGRSREGDPYTEVLPPDLPPGMENAVPKTLETVIAGLLVGEETVDTFDNIAIDAPKPCIDGVDNDGDGAVDHADPACQVDPLSNEHADVESDTRFRIRTSFFAGNPSARCRDFGVSRLAIFVADQLEACLVCNDQELSFALDLPESTDPRPLEVVAAVPSPGADESELFNCDVELTNRGAASTMFSGNYVEFDADFDANEFVTPFLEPIDGYISFRSFSENESQLRTCESRLQNRGEPIIDTVRVRVRDEAGAALDPNLLVMEGATAGEDGTLTFPCDDLMLLDSEPLLWGHYQLEVEALSNGTACFANGFAYDTAAIDLLPQVGNAFFNVERIVDDNGQPPVACRECLPNDAIDDCAGCPDESCCRDFICRGT